MSQTQSDKQIEAAVLSFLQDKGYHRAAESFKTEARSLSIDEYAAAASSEARARLRNHLVMHAGKPSFDKYDESFTQLRDWIASALDIYQAELVHILYPLFVYCYLDMVQRDMPEAAKSFFTKHARAFMKYHRDELRDLEPTALPEHFAASPTAKKYIDHKASVRLCEYSFDLLLCYLHESDAFLLLGILNHSFDLKVYAGAPETRSAGRPVLSQAADYDAEAAKEPIKTTPLDLDAQVDARYATMQSEASSIPAPAAKRSRRDASATSASTSAAVASTPTAAAGGSGTAADQSRTAVTLMRDVSIAAIWKELQARVAVTRAQLPSCCFFTFLNTQNKLTAANCSAIGDTVAGGFADSTVKVWQLAYKTRPAVDATSASSTSSASGSDGFACLVGHAGPVYSVIFSPDGQFLLSSSEDATIRLWSLKTRKNLVVYRGHGSPVWSLAWSPLGLYFASASADHTARLWATNKHQPVRLFVGHTGDVTCCAFHPNGEYLVTGSDDRTVRVWSCSSGSCVRIFPGHQRSVSVVAVSPRGDIVASAGWDGSVRLWDLVQGTMIAAWTSVHTSGVFSMDFSREGSLLVTGGGDHTVCVWDVWKAQQDDKDRREKERDKDRDCAEDDDRSPAALLAQWYTKRTPVFGLRFTVRNLLMGMGPFVGQGGLQ